MTTVDFWTKTLLFRIQAVYEAKSKYCHNTANNSIKKWKNEIHEKYKILAKFMSDRQHRDINAMKDTLLYMEYAKAYHFKKVRHVKTPYGDNCLTWVYCYYCHLNLKSHQNVDYTIKNPSAIGFLFTYSCLYCHLIYKKTFSAFGSVFHIYSMSGI